MDGRNILSKDASLIFDSIGRISRPNTAVKIYVSQGIHSTRAGLQAPAKEPTPAFISKARGLTCPPVVISALLDSPEARPEKLQERWWATAKC
jgi:adenylate kinase